jgi:hypothetical protein
VDTPAAARGLDFAVQASSFQLGPPHSTTSRCCSTSPPTLDHYPDMEGTPAKARVFAAQTSIDFAM